jgi:hypothetical protein
MALQMKSLAQFSKNRRALYQFHAERTAASFRAEKGPSEAYASKLLTNIGIIPQWKTTQR